MYKPSYIPPTPDSESLLLKRPSLKAGKPDSAVDEAEISSSASVVKPVSALGKFIRDFVQEEKPNRKLTAFLKGRMTFRVNVDFHPSEKPFLGVYTRRLEDCPDAYVNVLWWFGVLIVFLFQPCFDASLPDDIDLLVEDIKAARLKEPYSERFVTLEQLRRKKMEAEAKLKVQSDVQNDDDEVMSKNSDDDE
jgi:hypothetical protein